MCGKALPRGALGACLLLLASDGEGGPRGAEGGGGLNRSEPQVEQRPRSSHWGWKGQQWHGLPRVFSGSGAEKRDRGCPHTGPGSLPSPV